MTWTYEPDLWKRFVIYDDKAPKSPTPLGEVIAYGDPALWSGAVARFAAYNSETKAQQEATARLLCMVRNLSEVATPDDYAALQTTLEAVGNDPWAVHMGPWDSVGYIRRGMTHMLEVRHADGSPVGDVVSFIMDARRRAHDMLTQAHPEVFHTFTVEGAEVVLDKADADLVTGVQWFLADGAVKSSEGVRLADQIMCPRFPNEVVRYLDGNPLNLRRSNLRVTDEAQNFAIRLHPSIVERLNQRASEAGWAGDQFLALLIMGDSHA